MLAIEIQDHRQAETKYADGEEREREQSYALARAESNFDPEAAERYAPIHCYVSKELDIAEQCDGSEY